MRQSIATCALAALGLSSSVSCGRTNLNGYDEDGGSASASGGAAGALTRGGTGPSAAGGARVAMSSGGAPTGGRAQGGVASGGLGTGGLGTGGLGTGGLGTGGDPGCGASISDLEDGSGRICTGSGRVGVWYVFHDDNPTGMQWPRITAAGTPIETATIPDGRGNSERAIHTYGSGFNTWGAGVGFDLNFDGASYRVYDASRYQGVHFWARSSTRNQIRFRIGAESTTAIKYGGTCVDPSAAPGECVGPREVVLQLEPDWVDYTVSFAELVSAAHWVDERSRLTNIQFMLRGDFDFWIDDVAFLENEPNCCPDLPACAGGVHFADSNLRRAIIGNDAPGAVLTCAQACGIRSLVLSDPTISSLGGVECLSQLDNLYVSGPKVTDIAPLANLTKLHTLSFMDAQISDIGPLAPLQKLRQLTLDRDRIEDLRPLAGLLELQQLSLATNSITDVTPLGSLSRLSRLVLSENRIADASPVFALTALQHLDLSKNQITTLGQVRPPSKLTELYLDDNLLTDVSALGAASALTTLSVNRNRIGDASPLAVLAQLTTLQLSGNRVSRLDQLSGLANLWRLDLSQNQITSVSQEKPLPAHVFGLPSLTQLDLSNNLLVDVEGLAALEILYALELGHNQISNPYPLTALAGLSSLGLSYNSVHTLPAPFRFAALQTLDLSNNDLEAIAESALAGSTFNTLILSHNQLQNLNALSQITFFNVICNRCGVSAKLDVSNNQLRELSPLLLATWPHFSNIALGGNPLDCAAQASTIQALRSQDVAVDGCP
jgi:internalin A